MTEGHKQILEPLAKGKVYTLLEYAGSSGDISDPYGGDLEEYEEVAQEIYERACRRCGKNRRYAK